MGRGVVVTGKVWRKDTVVRRNKKNPIKSAFGSGYGGFEVKGG